MIQVSQVSIWRYPGSALEAEDTKLETFFFGGGDRGIIYSNKLPGMLYNSSAVKKLKYKYQHYYCIFMNTKEN